MTMQIDVADEIQLLPDLGISTDLRSVQPFIDLFQPRDEQDVEVRVERNGVIGAMYESYPAGPETVVHIFDSQQRVAHVLQRVDREHDIERGRHIEFFSFRAKNTERNGIAVAIVKDLPLHIAKKVEFRCKGLQSRYLPPLTGEIIQQDAGAGSDLKHLRRGRIISRQDRQETRQAESCLIHNDFVNRFLREYFPTKFSDIDFGQTLLPGKNADIIPFWRDGQAKLLATPFSRTA